MFKEVLIKEIMFSGTLGVIVDMTSSKTLSCKYRMLLRLVLLIVGIVPGRPGYPGKVLYSCPCHDFLFLPVQCWSHSKSVSFHVFLEVPMF